METSISIKCHSFSQEKEEFPLRAGEESLPQVEELGTPWDSPRELVEVASERNVWKLTKSCQNQTEIVETALVSSAV